jgi:protein-S-isoprenylcysteine O-methyltransferase Ste14
MTQDARQSLIALGSVTLFFGLFVVSLSLLKGINIPDWVLPLGLVLMAIDFGWRFSRWRRAKRSASGEHRP